MKIINIRLVLLLVCILIISLFIGRISNLNHEYHIHEFEYTSNVPAIQMYYYINKYTQEYDIPIDYAFAIAYQETRYQGPKHLSYNHAQTSSAGAVGPMQVMPATAKWMLGKTISSTELRTNIELNIQISMMLLRHLYDTYHDWKLVFGAYNTGRPVINQYALNVYYKKYRWINT